MKTVKVTEELFRQVKNELQYSDALMVAIKNHMSEKTVLQIKGSTDFLGYKAQVKAQHPPTKSTMRQDVADIKEMLIQLLAQGKENTLF